MPDYSAALIFSLGLSPVSSEPLLDIRKDMVADLCLVKIWLNFDLNCVFNYETFAFFLLCGISIS
jgi:hypothetical protein